MSFTTSIIGGAWQLLTLACRELFVSLWADGRWSASASHWPLPSEYFSLLLIVALPLPLNSSLSSLCAHVD
jgi:hypothetical protein